MAAPTLIHLRRVNSAANVADLVGTVVPAGRARVISKITVTNQASSTPTRVFLYAGATATSADSIAVFNLGPNEVYSESGIVLLAGEGVYVTAVDLPVGNVSSAVFGQEVDNL